jgi:chorismate mutase
MTVGDWIRHRLGVTSVRAIRGATCVAVDDPTAIHDAVVELVAGLADANALTPDEIVSAIFTATADLASAFPATAARTAGWRDVPLLSATEIPVPDALPRCIRVLLHVERVWASTSPRHVYLRDAQALRPDWVAPRRRLVRPSVGVTLG